LLEGLTRESETPLARLPLLSREEMEALTRWNATGQEYPLQEGLHLGLQEQARRTPQAPALLVGTQVLCYGDLNARANRLAHLLRRAGVGPERRVALCLERGADLLIGL